MFHDINRGPQDFLLMQHPGMATKLGTTVNSNRGTGQTRNFGGRGKQQPLKGTKGRSSLFRFGHVSGDGNPM